MAQGVRGYDPAAWFTAALEAGLSAVRTGPLGQAVAPVPAGVLTELQATRERIDAGRDGPPDAGLLDEIRDYLDAGSPAVGISPAARGDPGR